MFRIRKALRLTLAMSTGAAILAAASGVAVADDVPPPTAEDLLVQAETLAAELAAQADLDSVPDPLDIPVATAPSVAVTVDDGIVDTLLELAAELLDQGEVSDECEFDTTGNTATSVNAIGQATHKTTVSLDYCYNAETGEFEYISEPTVSPAVYSPLVKYLDYDHDISGGNGSLVAYYCTGVVIQNRPTCVDSPNHRFEFVAEDGKIRTVVSPR